ncbi:MAG: polysaccharide biosynthesis/export family protein [Isosphaeraceae bacterium]
MGQQGWRPLTRTVLVAHLLGVAVLGVCQFAFTSHRHPMACAYDPLAWERLCYWLQSGHQRPITVSLDDFEIHRLSETLAAVILLGTLLGWSIWTMRPFRLILRLRLRTLMAMIAIVPVECAGGSAVWNSWAQWDRNQRIADWNACWSAIKETRIRAGDILLVEVLETLPDRPIFGDYKVHPDGKIDLGHYGRVYVDSLTILEAKEKIILHLGRYLDDRQLGLVEFSESEPSVTLRRISPSESDHVFVDLE